MTLYACAELYLQRAGISYRRAGDGFVVYGALVTVAQVFRMLAVKGERTD